jgi:hypothetical protein
MIAGEELVIGADHALWCLAPAPDRRRQAMSVPTASSASSRDGRAMPEPRPTCLRGSFVIVASIKIPLIHSTRIVLGEESGEKGTPGVPDVSRTT